MFANAMASISPHKALTTSATVAGYPKAGDLLPLSDLCC